MSDDHKKRPQLPEYDQGNNCPTCGGETETGFGLAGGGYDVYTYCPKCEAIISKTQVDE